MPATRAWVLAACLTFLSPAVAPAAAGLSDIAATRACWIRQPLALVKCQSEGGRYPARLIHARPTTPDEESAWTLLPAGYDGIVPLKDIVSDVDRVAITPRFLVVRDTSGSVVVVAIEADKAQPAHFATLQAANEFLAGQGADTVDEGDFRTFEAVYREYGLRSSPPVPVLVAGAVGVTWLAAVLLVVWRRRRSHRLT